MTLPAPAASAPTAPAAESLEKIAFRFHPRVFAALGADLVTNDVVAVMELVKNAYDAGAKNVHVRFGRDSTTGDYLEIVDDGCGMSREVIKEVWRVVATPYKVRRRTVGRSRRRVSGDKGLGRLSAARLGDDFRMLTRERGCPCWDVRVRWTSFAEVSDVSEAAIELRRYGGEFGPSGTSIRIGDLKQDWNVQQLSDLQSNLSRLVPPFSDFGDFSLFFRKPGAGEDDEVRVQAHEFFKEPTYSISGSVNADGDIRSVYKHVPLSKTVGGRMQDNLVTWSQVKSESKRERGRDTPAEPPRCGPFSFEIRAWDLRPEDTTAITGRFRLKRKAILDAIRDHKGISLYRDGILVMPKSETARDWLGLDRRRVSKMGPRLSTSQIVGYVSVSSQENPDIRDTSDRERLIAGQALTDFTLLMENVIDTLEMERNRERFDPALERPMALLFDDLSPELLLRDVRAYAKRGDDARAVLPAVEAYAERTAETTKTIQRRFVYYSRLATVGTLAQMLVHEIRNRTTSIGRFLITMKDRLVSGAAPDLRGQRDRAEQATLALESLADRFSPLASRSFRRDRASVLEDRVRACLEAERAKTKALGVRCLVPESTTLVAVDPGELDAVLLNLITNSLYWLRAVGDRPREISFSIDRIEGSDRVAVEVEDSGPGIDEEDIERVFLPGVTRRPGGIGMGLTVASEIVSVYGGRMAVARTSLGASFRFDLPLGKPA